MNYPMVNARVKYTFRYRGVLIKQIYYFGKTIYLYKVRPDKLNVSVNLHNTKERIRKAQGSL